MYFSRVSIFILVSKLLHMSDKNIFSAVLVSVKFEMTFSYLEISYPKRHDFAVFIILSDSEPVEQTKRI